MRRRQLFVLLAPLLLLACSSKDHDRLNLGLTDSRSAALAQQNAGPKQIALNPKAGEQCFDKGVELYQSGKVEEAISQFIRAGELGDPRGFSQVGFFYEKGDGVKQNWSAAAHWYLKGATGGDALGMKNVGQCYEDGRGIQEDWVSAASWYRKAADKGYVQAEVALARAYQFGVGVAQDRSQAIEWDKKALAHGDQESAHWIRWLRNPLNNIGFRTTQEQELVMAGQLRTSGELLGADPAGILFHNSNERVAWLRGLRNRVDADEAQRRREREVESQQRHYNQVRQLESEGYSHSEAERRAGW